jgi:hypothetical protein
VSKYFEAFTVPEGYTAYGRALTEGKGTRCPANRLGLSVAATTSNRVIGREDV